MHVTRGILSTTTAGLPKGVGIETITHTHDESTGSAPEPKLVTELFLRPKIMYEMT